MDTGIGKGMLEIAFGLMSIALIALLLSRSQDTATVVGSVSSNFNNLLRTVTLQQGGVGR
jgi:hypothetical protein